MGRMEAHNPARMEETDRKVTSWPVAVVMDCVSLANNRWQTVQWEASEVVNDIYPAGSAELVLARDEQLTRIVHPGLSVRLFRDEAEGYLYNITSPEPKVFVLWRMHESSAKPERVTVSYHEGARWMDTDERVDGVPLPAEWIPRIRVFAEQHYRPEPKKQKRYASNKDKGRMGRID
jgi:hypothetical protein